MEEITELTKENFIKFIKEHSFEYKTAQKSLCFAIIERMYRRCNVRSGNTYNYCRPTFDQITDLNDENQVRHIKYNPFFKEYKEAVRIGHFILKRFSYNISKATNKLIETPPFWIDMPRLFELYVYSQHIKANPKERNKILYQFSTYGNALDILITHLGFQCIIDAKYKLHYNHGLVHANIRQIVGYARLKQVRARLELSDYDDSNIDCLIIYPDIDGVENLTLENIKSKRQPISAYHKVWKLNVRIPCIGKK